MFDRIRRFAILALVLAPVLALTLTGPAPVAADAAANKALVQRYYNLVNANRLEALPEVLADDFTIRTAPPDEDAGIAGLRQSLTAAHAGLPDFAIAVDDLIAEGDLVVVRTTISGTHLADFFGSPPTGREIITTAHDLWRVADGELAEVWHVEDILGVVQQLGAVPDDGGTMQTAPASTPAATGRSDQDGAGAAGENEELARRFLTAVFAEGDASAAADILDPAFAWHWHAAAALGAEGLLAYAADLQASFPDLRMEPEIVVAEGDRVAVLWTLSGTQRGEYAGMPATDRPVTVPGIDVHWVEDGRITETWSVRDDVGLWAQLGAFDRTDG